MITRTLLFTLFSLFAFQSLASFRTPNFPQDTLTCEQAIQKVGEEVLFKGKIINIVHTTTKKSGTHITYINLDQNYPHNVVTVAIMEKFIGQFDLARENYIGQEVLIKGLLIQNGNYKPAVFLENSEQLKLVN
ncbi:MAG: hypothetical protein AAF849_04140 [Bacteroidota bacterium]